MTDPTSVYIKPELLARIDQEAGEVGRSRSWLVCRAVEQLLEPVIVPRSAQLTAEVLQEVRDAIAASYRLHSNDGERGALRAERLHEAFMCLRELRGPVEVKEQR